MRRCASYLGLSVLEMQILWISGSSDTITLADMARLTTCSKETLEEAVMSLEQDDLVEQVSLDETRCVYVRPTDDGRELIGRLSNRTSGCRCPVATDNDRVRDLLEGSRKLVVELKGKGCDELIAGMAHRLR